MLKADTLPGAAGFTSLASEGKPTVALSSNIAERSRRTHSWLPGRWLHTKELAVAQLTFDEGSFFAFGQ